MRSDDDWLLLIDELISLQDIRREKQVFLRTRSRAERFRVKDVVFLAIMTTATLLTGGIMPLLVHIPVFGIIQLGLGIQFSFFPVLGLLKVRKMGSLTLMTLFSGILLVFMFPPMFLCLLVCAVIAESLTFLVFRGYKKDRAAIFASTVYLPLSIPFLVFYYSVMYDWGKGGNEAVYSLVSVQPLYAVLISLAVVAVSFIGSLLGYLLARELRKAGRFK